MHCATVSRSSSQPEQRAHRPLVAQLLVDQHMEHGQQQVDVTTGDDRDVLVGQPRGLGAAWIDHHDRAAALPHPLDALFGVRHGGHRPVRHGRIGPQDHQPVGAIDIGDRHEDIGSEDPPGRELLRELIDRRGGEEVAGQQRHPQQHAVQHRRTVCRRVSQIHADRARTVFGADLAQPLPDLPERLVPSDRLEPIADSAYRCAKPVRVVVQCTHRGGFGTDISLGQHIVGISLDPDDAVVLDGDPDSAVRLT